MILSLKTIFVILSGGIVFVVLSDNNQTLYKTLNGHINQQRNIIESETQVKQIMP